MTVTASTATGGEVQPQVELVSITIDDIEVSVPKGSLIIRAAEQLGIAIPRFCDHPLLEPVGACRQCLVEVEGQRKPLASCTTTVTDGMVVRTQLTSPVAEKAQHGVMEMLLINHPLDCPVCDKGGECPLQNQAMSNGRGESRFDGAKRTFPKPIAVSSQVLLDRERCVSCARCTRFSDEIAGDPFIALIERGSEQQVGIGNNVPFASYFSGNTVQICPVGALTGAAYRFRARPFDLVSTHTACEHCASGCALRTDHRRGAVMRRMALPDPEVNEEWNCDKGRWAFAYTRVDRITDPLVRDGDGTLVPTSWPDALATAAAGLRAAKGATAALPGGRLSLEDSYAWAKFARIVLGTNDIDFRARTHSAEEAAFLASSVAGRSMAVTYEALENAPVVVLAGLEPEEESPIVFLRLRKAVRRSRLRVVSIAPFASRGSTKLDATLVPTVPGAEPAALDRLAEGDLGELLGKPGAVVLVGERLAGVPGALSAAQRLATRTGATLAWVPRRAGERGALDAGALPNLLPGGRPVDDASARVDVAAVWGVDALPVAPGRDLGGILAAAKRGDVAALVVGGLEPVDIPDPETGLAGLDRAFVVSLELRHSAVTARADVVLPVAAVSEKSGTFLDWEGRERAFGQALESALDPDAVVLGLLAAELGTPLGAVAPAALRAELAELEPWAEPAAAPDVPAGTALAPAAGEAVLATWRLLLDLGVLQQGEPHLAGTARVAVARLSAATCAEVGVVDGDLVTVSSQHGAVTVPVLVTAMPDRVVWLPAHSEGCSVQADLGLPAGAVVTVAAGGGAS